MLLQLPSPAWCARPPLLLRRRYSRGEVDGQLAPGAGPNSPFDQPFYLLLNLALGGWMTENTPPEVLRQTLATPQSLLVDWVRVHGLEW